ncbi:transcriptional regulator GfcR [Halorhabdus sp. CUG00001]|uniref:transcriptional regulator GfcR n=1 Tax=Halorhabdus sp. CUG00001 TaxID=2600297 RepID=UPI00131CE745|nr:transcriptional regulator GfcR [Halorhabdus sp. CUG00001]
MKSLDDLIDGAKELTGLGLSKGEIADELNVSRETASWLVEQTDGGDAADSTTEKPHDIHVDWSAVGRDSQRLSYVGRAMADLLSKEGEAVDLTIGIGKSGGPLATTVARDLETDLSVYTPSKHRWDDDEQEDVGSFSRNFASIRDRDCYIVDDNIDTGKTMTETIQVVRERGGNPVAGVVLTDKHGDDTVEGVPIYSLIQIVQMTDA